MTTTSDEEQDAVRLTRDAQEEEQARRVVTELEAYFNRYGTPGLERLAAAVHYGMHRTLQQRCTVFMLCWFRLLATSNQFDLRNEASIKLARTLAPVIDDATRGTWQLPTI
jgi:hypothetical protein